jgi:hypothetical protein
MSVNGILSRNSALRTQNGRVGMMRIPRTVGGLEDFSRARLSRSFFKRDFLYSDISNLHGIPNLPADPDLALPRVGNSARSSSLCISIRRETVRRH